jgi:multiple sugar transport system permease protein
MERGLPRLSTRPRIGSIAKHIVLIVVAVIVAYPFYFMVTSSFKDTLEAIRTPPTIFPNELHPENYTDAWSRAPWGRYFINTIFVSISVTILEIITACLAAYAFARMKFRGKGILFTIFLATLMIPGEATLIPTYVVMSTS